MAATRTARVTLTFLMAFTVVVSVVAAPVAATGHDPTHVGDDDDPIEVDGDNDSVSVGTGDDSVTVDSDGVDTDTDDTTGGLESGSTDDATDGLATTQDEEDEELPFNYSDINATLSLVPVDLCRQADPPEAPDPPAELPVENPAPVDPTNPPSAPLTQCDVFNPYDPPFDPTDAPDDPSADYQVYEQQVGPDGVSIVVGGSGSADSDYPGGRTILGVQASQDDVNFVQYTRVNDGARDTIVFSDVQHAPGTRRGNATSDLVVIGRTAGADITCTGESCTFDQGAAPVDGQTIPTGGDGGGGSGGAPVDVPCQAPVGPGDAPEPPVDPSDPPEPLPPVENPVPVDPTNPPSAPLGPCDAYDPNDPPSPQPNPNADYTVYEMNDESVVVRGDAAYNRTGGPKGFTILGFEQGDDGELHLVQYSRFNDGQKPGLLFSDVRYTPGTRQGQAVVESRVIGKSVGASVVCDGDVCTVDQNGAPVGKQQVPTNSSGGGGGGGGAPVDVPCQPPVGPGDAPEPPVDPSDPPEPLPPVENPVPVDPTNPPSAPLGPCDVYDPNDPPSPQPNPNADYTVYEMDDDSVVVRGDAAYNRTGGPKGFTILAFEQEDNETTFVQYGRGNDGQKPFATFVVANVDRNSLTKAGFTGYQFDGGSAVEVRVFGKDVDLSVTCDGEFCYLRQNTAPVDDQRVRIATEDADEQESVGESTTGDAPDTTTSSDGGSSDGSTSDSSTTSDTTTASGSSSAGDTTTAATGSSAGSTVAATAPADATTAAVPVMPSAFADGIPDAASAAEALMGMV